MKRIIPLVLILFFAFSACIGGNNGLAEETTYPDNTEITELKEEKNGLFTASWLSYMELSVTKDRDTEEEYAEYIDEIFDNMKEVNITDVFVQVRPFADAFYPSSLFPVSSYVASEQGGELPFDILKLITERAKEKNLSIHAWINPYRVSSSDDISNLCKENPAYLWYEEGKCEDVVVSDEGIYFNPSSEKVRKLIVDGAKELLENYDIKGIHIDDYFYFKNCGDFDKQQYEAYTLEGGKLDLSSWRRENVNCLLSSLYIAVKSYGEDKIFSVSPSGDMDKCYNENYADVYLWCESDGYCDMIIPQIYFGFENENLPFEKCLSQWVSACKGSKTKLVVGLALYKSGTEDTFALSGKDEWTKNTDIISRQVKAVKEADCYGFSLYSGTYINFSETFLSEELHNLKNMI